MKKATGTSGKLKINVEEKFVESLEKTRNCYFLLKGCMVPYFIQKRSDLANSLIKFESINSPEETKVIAGKAIYLHNDQIIPSDIAANQLVFGFIEGLQLKDSNTEKLVGIITSVEEYPEQEIAIVKNASNQEFLVPVNEHNYKGMDETETIVYIEIPEGLLDL